MNVLPLVLYILAGLAYAIRPTDNHFLNFLNVWIASRRDSGVADDLRKKWISDFKWSTQ